MRSAGGTDASKGLSPRVRGNLVDGLALGCSPGSIPACAGEPTALMMWPRPSRVYPRVCGGTWDLVRRYIGRQGLSPRVRGNLHRIACVLPKQRSIPACAGEPSPHGVPDVPAEVYPRVCGGTGRRPYQRLAQGGLSPRVRGNRGVECGRIVDERSIPACAGEPGYPFQLTYPMPVYPRVCGGTAKRQRVPGIARGLSPRVRGNPIRPDMDGQGRGSIPACAGEPATRQTMAAQAAVYPRVCGGTPARPVHAGPHGGLSPRVRGNRVRRL